MDSGIISCGMVQEADAEYAAKVAAALEGGVDEDDEDRLIEQRRQRRAEIQRKHEEQQRLAGVRCLVDVHLLIFTYLSLHARGRAPNAHMLPPSPSCTCIDKVGNGA